VGIDEQLCFRKKSSTVNAIGDVGGFYNPQSPPFGPKLFSMDNAKSRGRGPEVYQSVHRGPAAPMTTSLPRKEQSPILNKSFQLTHRAIIVTLLSKLRVYLKRRDMITMIVMATRVL
jgi:hypothetical protein